MIDRIRRLWSAALRLANLRPPHGHMGMLRGEMTDREDARVAREADTVKRQDDQRRDARDGTTPPR